MLNQSTHLSVSIATVSMLCQDLRLRMTSVLCRPLMVSVKALASGLEPIASTCLVVGVTNAANRGLDIQIYYAFGVPDGNVLDATVAVVHQTALISWTVCVKRRFKRVEDRVGLGRSRRCPTEKGIGRHWLKTNAERGWRRCLKCRQSSGQSQILPQIASGPSLDDPEPCG